MPAVVFVTAYDQFAVKAFEVNALDYLLKPFDDRRFRTAMTKAKVAVRSAEAAPLHEKLAGLLQSTGRDRTPLTRIVVKDAGRVYFVKTEEIDWIQAASYYAKLHVGQRTHLIRESMNSFEERLDRTVFFRVSRSAIVNLDRVKEIQPFGGGSHLVILHDGTKVRLSRRRREKLEAVLEQSI
jgi:two-component system LytT family response regulator